jgi:2-polyprenyl-3-methyl-5-hydroxy-6-metoxy-1,4-benzoquinol methylase
MNDLFTRSLQQELLDADDIPFADIQQNMKELNIINSLLGGHAITVCGVKNLISDNKTISICEIGSGGGDNLKAISQWCKKLNISASFTGIDIKKECTDYARQTHPSLNAHWITSDYKLVKFRTPPDIIFSSLFCHHFSNPALVEMFKWMHANCATGFFINDLQRNRIAYRLIRIITSVFSSSYLVKNDAPLSVARAFRRKELINICHEAGISHFSLQWKWAFRYLLIVRK